MKISGSVYQLSLSLRHDVNTDIIVAGRYLRIPKTELGNHTFEGVIDDFPAQAKANSVLVAGTNMGCGSSREQAVHALLGSGIKMVIAMSFGDIFLRNSFNLGLPLFQINNLEEIESLTTGSKVEVDLSSGEVIRDGTERLQGVPISSHLLKILEAGGIMNLIAKNYQD